MIAADFLWIDYWKFLLCEQLTNEPSHSYSFELINILTVRSLYHASSAYARPFKCSFPSSFPCWFIWLISPQSWKLHTRIWKPRLMARVAIATDHEFTERWLFARIVRRLSWIGEAMHGMAATNCNIDQDYKDPVITTHCNQEQEKRRANPSYTTNTVIQYSMCTC